MPVTRESVTSVELAIPARATADDAVAVATPWSTAVLLQLLQSRLPTIRGSLISWPIFSAARQYPFAFSTWPKAA